MALVFLDRNNRGRPPMRLERARRPELTMPYLEARDRRPPRTVPAGPPPPPRTQPLINGPKPPPPVQYLDGAPKPPPRTEPIPHLAPPPPPPAATPFLQVASGLLRPAGPPPPPRVQYLPGQPPPPPAPPPMMTPQKQASCGCGGRCGANCNCANCSAKSPPRAAGSLTLAPAQAPVVFARGAVHVPAKRLRANLELPHAQHISAAAPPCPPGECVSGITCCSPDPVTGLPTTDCQAGGPPCRDRFTAMGQNCFPCNLLPPGIGFGCCTFESGGQTRNIGITRGSDPQNAGAVDAINANYCREVLHGTYLPRSCDDRLKLAMGFGFVGEVALAEEFEELLKRPTAIYYERGCCEVFCCPTADAAPGLCDWTCSKEECYRRGHVVENVRCRGKSVSGCWSRNCNAYCLIDRATQRPVKKCSL